MRILYLFFILVYVVACNETHESDEVHHHTETKMHAGKPHHQLVLNKGEKWQADVTTNEAVEKMEVTIKNFQNKNDNSIENYNNLGEEMQKYYSDLVSKCTMKGPEHDQLHVFLELLQPKIKGLIEVDNRAEGETLVAETETLISDYFDYFK